MKIKFNAACIIFVALMGCTKETESPANQVLDGDEKSISSSELIATSPANFYTNLFDQSGGGWTGGDGAYSIPLPDGRILWTFGDSFLGTVNPDYTRPGQTFYNNVFVIQDGDELTTLAGGTPENPSAFIKPFGNQNDWYWPGDGTVVGNKLYMYLFRLRANGEGGIFGFDEIGTDMAIFSLPNLEVIDQFPIIRSDQILSGCSIYEEGGYIYSYSVKGNLVKKCLANRMAISNPGVFEYWNGNTWTNTLDPAAYLKKENNLNLDVSVQFSVFKYEGKYYLMTQGNFLGSDLLLYKGDSPVGPWSNTPNTFYITPETGGDIITYNAFLHPHITHPTKGVLLTYSVNSFDFFDLFEDARIYRPRFIWVKPA